MSEIQNQNQLNSLIMNRSRTSFENYFRKCFQHLEPVYIMRLWQFMKWNCNVSWFSIGTTSSLFCYGSGILIKNLFSLIGHHRLNDKSSIAIRVLRLLSGNCKIEGKNTFKCLLLLFVVVIVGWLLASFFFSVSKAININKTLLIYGLIVHYVCINKHFLTHLNLSTRPKCAKAMNIRVSLSRPSVERNEKKNYKKYQQTINIVWLD